MTVIYKLDLNILKIYLYTINEVGSSRHSKVIVRNLKLSFTLIFMFMTLKYELDLDF